MVNFFGKARRWWYIQKSKSESIKLYWFTIDLLFTYWFIKDVSMNGARSFTKQLTFQNRAFCRNDEGYRRISSQGDFSSSSDENSKLYTSPASSVPDVLSYPIQHKNNGSTGTTAGSNSDDAFCSAGGGGGGGGGGSSGNLGNSPVAAAFGFPYSTDCHKTEDSKES